MRTHYTNTISQGRTGLRSVAIFLLLALAATSCNKPFDNTLKEDYGADGGAGKKQKMLVIIVDGAVGKEVQKAQPPFLNVLTDNAIYSWDGLTDTRKTLVTNALGWTTLLTGATSVKHKVTERILQGMTCKTIPLFSPG